MLCADRVQCRGLGRWNAYVEPGKIREIREAREDFNGILSRWHAHELSAVLIRWSAGQGYPETNGPAG